MKLCRLQNLLMHFYKMTLCNTHILKKRAEQDAARPVIVRLSEPHCISLKDVLIYINWFSFWVVTCFPQYKCLPLFITLWFSILFHKSSEEGNEGDNSFLFLLPVLIFNSYSSLGFILQNKSSQRKLLFVWR